MNYGQNIYYDKMHITRRRVGNSIPEVLAGAE